jgi:hypothetical protein
MPIGKWQFLITTVTKYFLNLYQLHLIITKNVKRVGGVWWGVGVKKGKNSYS